MQAVYRIWGKVTPVQSGCHSPVKEASEAEDSTVGQKWGQLALHCQLCVC